LNLDKKDNKILGGSNAIDTSFTEIHNIIN